jgi:hypothetical protein
MEKNVIYQPIKKFRIFCGVKPRRLKSLLESDAESSGKEVPTFRSTVNAIILLDCLSVKTIVL